MPRCCNENKPVSSVNDEHINNKQYLLENSRTFSIGARLQLDGEVERSHRRLRCDLSPAPTTNNVNNSPLNIKFIGAKVY